MTTGARTSVVALHHVALAVRDDDRRRLLGLLSADERARAATFHFAADRDRFVVTRAHLRLVLARAGAGSAAHLRFAYGAHGKPWLPAHPALRFNVSHTGEHALIAVTHDAEVGVDLEPLARGRSLEEVVRAFFSPAEAAALARLDGAARWIAAQRVWCRKEAYAKARGLGLGLPFDSFDVAVDPTETRAGSLLLATRPRSEDARAWHLRDVAVVPDYAAAVAVDGQAASVRLFRNSERCYT